MTALTLPDLPPLPAIRPGKAAFAYRLDGRAWRVYHGSHVDLGYATSFGRGMVDGLASVRAAFPAELAVFDDRGTLVRVFRYTPS